MIKIVSFKICPFFQYVTAMLKAKNIPFEVEYADFDNCLFEVSPNGKAPIVITEDKQVLFDADAIVNYLDRQYDGLYQPKTVEEQAFVEAWSNYGSKNFVPQCTAMRSVDQNAFDTHWPIFEKALINIEKQLNDQHSYFFGEQLSRVDVA